MPDTPDTYREFVESKTHTTNRYGFTPTWMPDFLFDFQSHLVEWSINRGRGALFADCGLGKTPMELVWAENVVRHTNKPVLIATPLAVSYQTLREAEKFDIDAVRVIDGSIPNGSRIIVTNYERLENFDPDKFSGFVCDESSILKNFDGTTRKLVTSFMRRLPYRLLCTATAAPNDYTELGTSSEALGEMGHTDMLGHFFKNDQGNSVKTNRLWSGAKWRFKGHASVPFWRWVSTWARAMRRPSDFGFDDGRFELPALTETTHVVTARNKREGMLFEVPAVGLREEREERRRTITERCEMVAKLASHDNQVLVWCHLNPEGDLLTKLIPGAEQVRGSDSDDVKESRLMAFANGDLRALVTKPSIGAWGLNFQSCSHVIAFPSHSYEQYYQGVRRCWRFGQTQPVHVDIVSTEGESGVAKNLKRKAVAADSMFSALVREMSQATPVQVRNQGLVPQEVPSWM